MSPISSDIMVAAGEKYAEKAGWKDVKPIFHTEAENGCVAILYTEEFAETFAYFRAVVQTGELSERVLYLTTQCANLNPANYTVWMYRRDVLKHLNSDLEKEMKYVSSIIEDNPKNYQVWHHRRLLVEWMAEAKNELEFTAEVLKDDSKNYHAWQHRQWVVKKFNLFSKDDNGSGELEFSTKLLMEDLRNNSAWNYRFFIVSQTNGFNRDVTTRELELTKELIVKAPHNESSWNYLSGILLSSESGVDVGEELFPFCEKLYDDEKFRSPQLLAFMVEILSENANVTDDSLSKAYKLLAELELLDPRRKNYWIYRRRALENREKS